MEQNPRQLWRFQRDEGNCTEAQPRKGQPGLTLPTLPSLRSMQLEQQSLPSGPSLFSKNCSSALLRTLAPWDGPTPQRVTLCGGSGSATQAGTRQSTHLAPAARCPAQPSPTAFASPPLPGHDRQDSLQSHQVFPVFSFSLSQLLKTQPDPESPPSPLPSPPKKRKKENKKS